jgi:aryl-alcohol dehydrogenase-like predicted oxidoreductase
MLGGAAFGNEYKGLKLDKDKCFAIMDKAWELGIRTIDTARGYGDSEEIIADWCHDRGKRLLVYTKGRSKEDFDRSTEILGKLIHAKLWHNYTTDDEIDCQIDGVSCYDSEWFDLMHQTDISIIQVPWNIIDRQNTMAAKMAHDYGLEAICRSIFIRGEAFKMADIAGRPFWTWCLQDIPEFDYAIIGVDSAEQLEEIMNVPRHTIRYTDEGVVS